MRRTLDEIIQELDKEILNKNTLFREAKENFKVAAEKNKEYNIQADVDHLEQVQNEIKSELTILKDKRAAILRARDAIAENNFHKLNSALSRTYLKTDKSETSYGLITETHHYDTQEKYVDPEALVALRELLTDDHLAKELKTLLDDRINPKTKAEEPTTPTPQKPSPSGDLPQATDAIPGLREIYDSLLSARKAYSATLGGVFRTQSKESTKFYENLNDILDDVSDATFQDPKKATDFQNAVKNFLESVDSTMPKNLTDQPKTTFQKCLIKAMSNNSTTKNGRLEIKIQIKTLEKALDSTPAPAPDKDDSYKVFYDLAVKAINNYSAGGSRGPLASIFQHTSDKVMEKNIGHITNSIKGNMAAFNSDFRKEKLFEIMDRVVERVNLGEKSALINCMIETGALQMYLMNNKLIRPDVKPTTNTEENTTSSDQEHHNKL